MAIVLPRAAVVQRLAKYLCIQGVSPDVIAPPQGVLSECLRDTLVRFSAQSDEHESRPVHVLSLLGGVRRRIESIWPTLDTSGKQPLGDATLAEDEDPLRRALDDLERVGDAAHIGSGYWLPTPLRLIDVGMDTSPQHDVLVLGTIATRALRLSWHPKVRRRSVVRSIPFDELPEHVRIDDSVWQGLEDWLGIPTQSLSDWTDSRLMRARSRLAPASQDVDAFEYYNPIVAAKRPQRYRWVMSTSGVTNPPPGLMLCRARYGNNDYAARHWLGTLQWDGGAIRPVDEAEVRLSDVTRLMYGLDLRAGCPTRALIEDDGADVTITLFNRLPAPEWRLLLAVAQRDVDEDGYFRNRYLVPRTLVPMVVGTLGQLRMIMSTAS